MPTKKTKGKDPPQVINEVKNVYKANDIIYVHYNDEISGCCIDTKSDKTKNIASDDTTLDDNIFLNGNVPIAKIILINRTHIFVETTYIKNNSSINIANNIIGRDQKYFIKL